MIWVLILIMMLTSCSDGDGGMYESTQFYSAKDTSAFVAKLQIDGIPYRLENNAVYYPVAYRDKVKEIAKEVITTAHRPTAYSFLKKERLDSFKRLLAAEGIGFGETTINGEFVVFLEDKSDSVKVAEIYSDFMADQ